MEEKMTSLNEREMQVVTGGVVSIPPDNPSPSIPPDRP